MIKESRVVVTGMGVIAPNGLGVADFTKALQDGRSGIKRWESLAALNFKCQIGGVPPITEEYKEANLPEFLAKKITNKAIIYACLAGLEAWKDAGLEVNNDQYDADTGIVLGSGALSLDSFIGDKLNTIDNGEHRRLGSRSLPESMHSGGAAFLNSILGLGNRIITNSSACISGSEAVLLGYEHIKAGKAKRMLCGSTEGDGRYIWAGFDSMRVLCSDANENPSTGSRPMSSTSSGLVPGGGAGAFVLESLESAQARGAKIYAEILGGEVNSGGQRNGGTMTAPNSLAVVQCIKNAIKNAGIRPNEIDLISGHLTSTKGDPIEVANWKEALGLSENDFPYINAPKSMIGHCIGGAGSIELVGCIVQMKNSFIHPNLNINIVHPEIQKLIPLSKIPKETIVSEVNTVIKSNFGFGDLNCVIVLKKWS